MWAYNPYSAIEDWYKDYYIGLSGGTSAGGFAIRSLNSDKNFVCAEDDAIVQLRDIRKNPCLSIAYDRKLGKFKSACSSMGGGCAKTFDEWEIEDLKPHLTEAIKTATKPKKY
ncbi:hypothetical protein [Robbsia sp. KACC 23696]|uniref:hypothetical protein n=1 Tax=Robbsia sp. KACC 23696 TaxID=3149231 RepID=UPI00325BFA01